MGGENYWPNSGEKLLASHTPVAIGNMNAVTSRFGPSTKAFLVVPLIGAFFIDVANAIVIKFFVSLPLLQQL